ncbi:hypothetical protein BDK51DRAFT_16571 [Blyttiomyces helicus]|uniref:Phosphotransferase n=1 Tax=Blyttiomyces helicus TaxID=388810 RepID=A0A4P9W7N0_9FUNG|nr:hypothetical protein BDK51DRAFT_16571 [Blyttiomyces helicus]|eukprot:RKO87403.1 hypothetical protein BDK51DRAFT_16571 [Blyttiomyces helicus]
MTSFWADHRGALFLFGVTTGVAASATVQYLRTLLFGPADHDFHGHTDHNKDSLQDPNQPNQETLARLERDFTLTTAQLQSLVKVFVNDMKRGLRSDTSVFKMIPSHVTSRPNGTETGTVLALDLGGSNFRVCEVNLEGKGVVRTRQRKFVVSDDLKTGTGEELFDFFADCVIAFLAEIKLPKDVNMKLGFTFSFPVQQLAINKGIAIQWTKGFTASGVEGKDVVGLLQDAFHRKGLKIEVSALANDTVGTLIAHAYVDASTYVGVILGTGTNAAYVERVDQIPKWKGAAPSSGEMVINMEWGAWGSEGVLLPTTSYDKQLDRASANPRAQIYEKMISGLYLGEITRYVLVDLISTGELFRGRGSAALAKPYNFDTANMSRIERDHTIELSDTRSVLEELSGIQHTSLADRRLVKRVCELIGTRAARLSAVGIAGVITKINRLDGCTVAVDGSVFEYYPHFANRIRDALREVVGVNAESIVLAQARDGSGQGAALIAAIN